MLFPFADFEFRIDFVMLVFDLSWRFEGRLQDCKEIWPGWLIFRTEGGHIPSENEHEFQDLMVDLFWEEVCIPPTLMSKLHFCL